nr:neuron navigator 3-like [Cherax quadricarinatus]
MPLEIQPLLNFSTLHRSTGSSRHFGASSSPGMFVLANTTVAVPLTVIIVVVASINCIHFLLQLENISASLAYLAGVGVALDGLTAKDIKDGNLKAILSLFFALSRYKQQQKQAQQERKELEKLREKKQESEMVTTAASK